jgi:hypothetical protein
MVTRNQGQTDSGFGHQEGENTATERDFGQFGSGLGVPHVDYRQYQSEIAATTSPYLSAGVDICGSGGYRVRSAAQTSIGIFENAFADQWTANMDDHLTEEAPSRADIIIHFIKICGFSHDSSMVRYIDQQQWSELAHIVMHGLEDSKSFEVFRDDGISTLGKTMLIHQKLFQSFLLYYKRQTLWEEEDPSEAEVMCWNPEEFKTYLTTKAFHDDHAQYCGLRSAITSRSSNGSGNQGGSRLSPSAPGVANRTGALTAQEFRRSVKCGIAHYPDLKDDKGFRIWNRGFVSKAKMHHTHLVLDKNYVPKMDEENAVFQGMQILTYAVMEEHLKTDKGKSLVSKYEVDNDAQSIYCELKKHGTLSTAAWLAGDTLMKYIINAKYQVNGEAPLLDLSYIGKNSWQNTRSLTWK